jgi:hypothetical protein
VPEPEYRLGIDVGGTNTDAVIMDPADRVVAKAKVPCTPDITGGITRALDAVLRTPGADPRRISHVMLGTTHATNAVLERRNLRRVAVIRIGARPPSASGRCSGGHATSPTPSPSGRRSWRAASSSTARDMSPLDTDAIARFLGEVGGAPRASSSPACSPRSRRGTNCWRPRSSSGSSARCTSRSAMRSARSACWSGRTPPYSTGHWPGSPATWPKRCGPRSPRTTCSRTDSSRRTTAP